MIERLYHFEKHEDGAWAGFATAVDKAGLSEALKLSRALNDSDIRTRVRTYVLSNEEENP